MNNQINNLDLDTSEKLYKKITKQIKRKNKKLEATSLIIPSLVSITLASCSSTSNNIPIAAPNTTVTMDEDTADNALGIEAPTDLDVDDILTITVDSTPSGGTIFTADGTEVNAGDTLTVDQLTGLVFTPNANASSDLGDIGVFSYTVDDGNNGSASSQVAITVNAVQDPPTIDSANSVSVDENTTSIMTIDGNDLDEDTLTYSISGGADQSLFTIDAATGELSFVSNQDFESPADSDGDNNYEVQVTVDDGNGNTVSQDITVTVTDKTTSITISNASIDENSASANVGDLSSYIDDVNATDVFTYSLSGTGSDSFEVVDGSLKLKDGVSADFETTGSYAITVTASSGGANASFLFTITVNDLNDAPTGVTLSSLGIPEKIDGSIVGAVGTTDQDSGDTHTYTVSDDRFEIVDGDLKLKSGNTVDYATETTITLSITTTDAAGETFTQEFTLLVGSIQISSTSFAENSAGVVVGDLSMTDPDFTSNVTYTLSGDDSSSFEVVNGQLKIKDGVSADFETKSSYSVTITATDDASHEASLTYTINVTDVNEVPTAIALSATAINENEIGATIGDLTTTDVDAGDTVAYTLSGADADSFEVVDGKLKLKSTVTADFETKASYSVTLTATDSGGLSISKDFTVTITDTNDTPTLVTAIADQSIDEDSALSFTMPTATFNDVDAGDSLTYSATLSNGSALPTWLTFNATTGIFSGTPLNDNVGTISITITATDSSDSAVTDTFDLTIVNTNDAPTEITLSANSIDENSSGADIGDLTTSDVDVGDTHTYSLTGTDASSFEEVDGKLKLKSGVSGDYENKSSYSVTITSTDVAGVAVSQSFTISINDINEAPTAISLSASAIDENTTAAVVGTLTATDPDASDTVTLELSGTDADSFEIVEGKLQLKSDVSADYEVQTSYSITVTATDAGGLTTTQDFTVNVNNLNDNTPEISSDATFSMAENTNVVGTITGTDADGDTLTYSISGGDDSGLFTIDASTGELTLQAKTNGITTSDTSLPIKLTNMVDNGDGTYTVDIEIDPTFNDFAALSGFTIWFSTSSSDMVFTKDDITLTADGTLDQITTLSDGRIKVLWADTTNTLEAGKIGTLTYTPTAGSTDLPITIETKLTGGDKDSIDATNSSIDTSIYQFTIVRTDVDYEDPADTDTDNVYKVTVQVSDGTNTVTQDIEVTVTDDPDGGAPESDRNSDGNNDIGDDEVNDPINPNDPDIDIIGNIDISNFSLWANEFDFYSIILPTSVNDHVNDDVIDLTNLIGMFEDQAESLILDFESINESSIDIDIIPDKSIVENFKDLDIDPVIDPLLEEYIYTSELG